MSNGPGYFELLIKVYFANEHPAFPKGGVMSQALNRLKARPPSRRRQKPRCTNPNAQTQMRKLKCRNPNAETQMQKPKCGNPNAETKEMEEGSKHRPAGSGK